MTLVTYCSSLSKLKTEVIQLLLGCNAILNALPAVIGKPFQAAKSLPDRLQGGGGETTR